jgi:ABC-type nickel/cobalt efflux system permease component RcnA
MLEHAAKGISLVGTGIALGIFHVLTGPDHLSALATLSANVDGLQAFCLGIRWGIGHSTGLLLVGVVFILMTLNGTDENIEIPRQVSEFFESLVGIFMLLLGVYGIRRAWERRPKVYGTIGESLVLEESPENVEILTVSESHHDHSEAHSTVEHADSAEGLRVQTTAVEEEDVAEVTPLFPRIVRSVSTKSMAIVAGIIHGLAGPGGVLGVIPAVQLHDARLATVYLGSFCASSTLTMGVFAILYGGCSSRLATRSGGHREFLIECASASLSILVGVTWLILLSIGKLEDVFP